MIYLIVIFLLILIVGILANHELAGDRKRIRGMMREYSFRTYSPDDEEASHPEKEEKE